MKKLKNQSKLNEAFALAAGLIVIGGMSAGAQTVIFNDPFGGSGNLNSVSASAQGINGVDNDALPQNDYANQTIDGLGDLVLNSGTSGYGNGYAQGVMFATAAAPTTMYNWAASAGASAITASGGMTVSFQWIPSASSTHSDDWIYFNVGENPSSGINGTWWNDRIFSSTTSDGLIFAANGKAESWQNGADKVSVPSAFALTGSYNIVLTYDFTSWAPGSPVTMSASVNGTPALADSFTWNAANGGANYFGLGAYQTQTGSDIDNFEIQTLATQVPEPSTLAMLIGGFGMLISRKLRRS